jgi:hypothetical protein
LLEPSVEFHQSAPSALYTLIVVNYKISPSVLLPSKASSSASLATKRFSDTSSSDGKSLFVIRDHITFDPQLFPFKLKPTSSPDWQTFYNLTNPVVEGAVLHKSPSATPENPMPDYASDESDLDPDFDSPQKPESADINNNPTYESSSDDDSPDNDSAPIHTEDESPTNLTRPSRARQPVQRYKTTHTPRPPRSVTAPLCSTKH